MRTCMALDALNLRYIRKIRYTHYAQDDPARRRCAILASAASAVQRLNHILRDGGETDSHFFRLSDTDSTLSVEHVVRGDVCSVVMLL